MRSLPLIAAVLLLLASSATLFVRGDQQSSASAADSAALRDRIAPVQTPARMKWSDRLSMGQLEQGQMAKHCSRAAQFSSARP
jgi:hypothetical protein